MRRLTAYLARQFIVDAAILFGIVSVLLWLVQCLRVFDIVSVKGQSLLTLAAQGVLTMPPLVLTFAFVCVGIGLARALNALRSSQQLNIIHIGGGLGAALRATLLVAGFGTLATLVLANIAAPAAYRALGQLNAEIAADLVSNTLRPGQLHAGHARRGGADRRARGGRADPRFLRRRPARPRGAAHLYRPVRHRGARRERLRHRAARRRHPVARGRQPLLRGALRDLRGQRRQLRPGPGGRRLARLGRHLRARRPAHRPAPTTTRPVASSSSGCPKGSR
jgi:hypothetical protein